MSYVTGNSFMKYYLTCLFFLFNLATYSQLSTNIAWQSNIGANHGDTIYYDTGRKLVWNDFKGKPDNGSIAAAITSSGFGYACKMKVKNMKGGLSISVYCFYNKMLSWVKPGQASDYALLHEQHHFDITYIATCLFIKKLKAAVFTIENYQDQLDKIYNDSYNELEKMQNDYDGQTKNGRVKSIQAEWNNRIELQLASIATN